MGQRQGGRQWQWQWRGWQTAMDHGTRRRIVLLHLDVHSVVHRLSYNAVSLTRTSAASCRLPCMWR